MRYFSENHLGFESDGKGAWYLFLTKQALDHLEEAVAIFFPEHGSLPADLQEGALLAVVESTKSAIDLEAPLALRLIEVHQELAQAPGQLHLGKAGWLVRVELQPQAIASKLLSESDYLALIGK